MCDALLSITGVLIFLSLRLLSPCIYHFRITVHEIWQARRQNYNHVPTCTASAPTGQYQITPLDNNDRCVNNLSRLVSREWKKKTQTFDEDSKLHVPHVSGLNILLEREEKHKKKLVVFIETAACVAKHLVRQILNHVVQSLRSEWRLLRPVQKLTDYSSLFQGRPF